MLTRSDRVNAARLIRDERRRPYPRSPWNICAAAAARANDTRTYEAIRSVAIKFRIETHAQLNGRMVAWCDG